MTSEFWATFPGPVIAILTIFVCGFAAVYFLGAKGFCTYACPYGGFFGLVDQVAPARILVTDDCEHCGHCTAVCTSNVRVHEEVALYGMVVDPGCMKCMDCVSVCPNDALYFGIKRPSLGAKPIAPRKPPAYTFTLGEELLFAVVGLGTLFIFRGLYGQVPLLMAMGLAALTGFLFMQSVHMVFRANVRLQQFQFKRGGRVTSAGWGFVGFLALCYLVTFHSAWIQYNVWAGHRAWTAARIPDEVWFADHGWMGHASATQKAQLSLADFRLTRVYQWGLMPTPAVMTDLVWLNLARNDDQAAETTMRELVALRPNQAEFHRGLAGVLRKQSRFDGAEESYRRALELKPDLSVARTELAAMLISQRRFDDAVGLFRQAADVDPATNVSGVKTARLLIDLGRFDEARAVLEVGGRVEEASSEVMSLSGIILVQTGDVEAGFALLERAIERDPAFAGAQYNLGFALLSRDGHLAALPHLGEAVRLAPGVALYRYNLAVATFMNVDLASALTHIKEATRLDPLDPDAYGFLAVVLQELGDEEGSQSARDRENQLRKK